MSTTFFVGWYFGIGTWEAWWVANAIHFVGGAYAFFFVRAVFYYTKPYHRTTVALWMETALFIAGALILGVFWEWFEFILDRYRVFIAGEPSLMTYADNIGDLIIDFLGSVVVGVYLYVKHKT